MEPDIVIICPNCSGKAAFSSPSVVRQTVVVPSLEGKVTCPMCGLSKAHTFSSTDYFYKIEIGGRSLFARNLGNADALRKYFAYGGKSDSPELDFPKVFYECREEIVRKLGDMIATHL
jgi:rubredoxin